MSIVEIRPYRAGWQCSEGTGVVPYFVEGDAKQSAIGYSNSRMQLRTGEIRIYNSKGELEETLRFKAPGHT